MSLWNQYNKNFKLEKNSNFNKKKGSEKDSVPIVRIQKWNKNNLDNSNGNLFCNWQLIGEFCDPD